MLVVNKPSGLLSQPGSLDDSVIHRLKNKFQFVGQVHRLDQSTSGIMVFGLSKKSQSNLSIQFQDRNTFKLYEAIVYGKLNSHIGNVNLPIRCDWPNRPRQEIHQSGKQSLTHWQLVNHEEIGEKKEICSRVLLIPHTGRSHQLRIHMSELGFPILGDYFYANEKVFRMSSRLNLHAKQLNLNHPITKQRLSFTSKTPF